MRWPRFVTSMGISRLFRGLMLLALLKLAVIGVAAWNGGPADDAGPARSVVAAVTGTSSAMAQQAATPAAQPSAQPAAAGNAAAPAAAPAASSTATMDRQELLAKQEELNRREASLNQLDKDLDAKLAKLHDLEAKLSSMLKDAQDLKDKKMAHLVNVYSNMKAKQAAQVLETLDQDIAVKILAGMQGRQAGEVLTYVTPKKAAKLSEALTKLQTQF